jgi:hypothetical protein
VVILPEKSSCTLPYLEWELMDKTISITNVDDQENLPKGNKRIEIVRDEDYNLKAVLYFEERDFFRHKREAEAGTVVSTFAISGSDFEKIHHYTLESCYIDGWKTQTDYTTGKTLATANIGLQGLRTKTIDREPARLCEWCLNGPYDHIFSRVTDRKLLSTHIRNRLKKGEGELDSAEIPGESSSRGVDFLVVKTGSLQFMVGKVPTGFGPSWSSNVGIEYKKAWGPIPDESLREKIADVCSFVFGRQLLNIGYTLYDKENYVIETYAHSPIGNEAKSNCGKPDNPPIAIRSIPPNHRTEEVIAQLLPEYIQHREDFRLKEALWNLWISDQMPVGPNIPVLASALESIIKGWFASASSKSQGCFMSQSEFEELLKPEFSGIKNKLNSKLGEKEVSKIINTVIHSNSFGPTERYRAFFKEIKLNLTKLEDEAIRERHKFTHGDAIFDNENWALIAHRKAAFETLLNKVILRVLSYSEDFIDRSDSPWVTKQQLKNFTSL